MELRQLRYFVKVCELRSMGRAAAALCRARISTCSRTSLCPLPPLWDLPNVVVTPHTAGHSDGNEARVAGIFLDNLRRWVRGEPLLNRVA